MLEKKPTYAKAKIASMVKTIFTPGGMKAAAAGAFTKFRNTLGLEEAMFDANPKHVKIIKSSDVRKEAESIVTVNSESLAQNYPTPTANNRTNGQLHSPTSPR